MRRLIRRLAEWTNLLFKPTGRLREEHLSPPARLRAPQPVVASPAIAPTVHRWFTPIDGASTPLVRPYLAAHEREEKARIQRLRRDALWCATYGVDLDTRDIHACLEVAS
ncbi:hypothetical protein ABZ027_30810 [Streptomyces sp. NPDC006332]|uniref:hypothetical protein n=1 Tax=Streptomyces sp. NPDC006332 TaxID=3155456 RepID=UPI0033A953E2